MIVGSTEAERLLLSRRQRVRIARASRSELVEIDAALARIADGTYGMCEICGGAIGRDRLRALPEIRHCLACSSSR